MITIYYKTFKLPQKVSLGPFEMNNLSQLLTLSSTDLLSIIESFAFSRISYKRNEMEITSCVEPLLLSIMFLKLIHAIVCSNSLFLFSLCKYCHHQPSFQGQSRASHPCPSWTCSSILSEERSARW